jgi:DUF971 family protein
MSELLPKSITANRKESRLFVEWSDGQTCAYPFDLLRNACPCAQCRGGHENMRPEPDPNMLIIPLMATTATKLKNLEAVGNYAINIEWEDGHKYGIYNWHYLYVLCQEMKARAKTDV